MIFSVRKNTRQTVAAGAALTAVLALSACAGGIAADDVAGLPDYAKVDPTNYRPDLVSDRLSSADSDQSEEGFQRCPEASSDPASTNNYQTICTYLDNNSQVFTGPNKLGPATYSEYTNNLPWPQWTNTTPQDDLGNSWLWSTQSCNPWGQRGSALPNTERMIMPPGTFSDIDTSTMLAGTICSPGAIARISYMPPAPLPAYDIFELQMLPWDGSRAWGSNQNNAGQCSNGKYTECTVTHVGDGYWSANYVYSINNYPVTIQLDNNMNPGNTMALSGAPRTANFVLDPAGGNPTTIGAGTTGYFGGYARTPVAGSNPSSSSSPSPTASGSQAPITNLDASGFSAVYTVSGGDLAGTQFVIQVAIDPNTRQLAEGSVCIPIGATTTQNPICTPQLVGAAGSPQTLVLNFSE